MIYTAEEIRRRITPVAVRYRTCSAHMLAEKQPMRAMWSF